MNLDVEPSARSPERAVLNESPAVLEHGANVPDRITSCFCRRTGDRLFFFFAIAFAILGAQRTLLGLSSGATEDVTLLYALRLGAFLMILSAIIAKNRGS